MCPFYVINIMLYGYCFCQWVIIINILQKCLLPLNVFILTSVFVLYNMAIEIIVSCLIFETIKNSWNYTHGTFQTLLQCLMHTLAAQRQRLKFTRKNDRNIKRACFICLCWVLVRSDVLNYIDNDWVLVQLFI